ncbi:MAG: hypothetical protein HYX40_07445 [Sphingobacteriales bacterium]|nr:hypothetical protein [Sphingobacteriales bacterium]
MFVQVWKKYLPVISLLLKRSASSPQVLKMSGFDFTKAAGGRKIKYNFDIELVNGRLNPAEKHSTVAKDFALFLQDDAGIKGLLKKQTIRFTLSSGFEMAITNVTPVEEDTEQAEEVSENANNTE